MGLSSKEIIGIFVIISVLCCCQIVETLVEPSYATLTCTDTGLNVTFVRSIVEGDGRPYTIAFQGSEHCYVDSSNTSNIQDNTIWISALYTECGIRSTNVNTNLRYNQTLIITYGGNLNTIVNNADYDFFQLVCDVPYNFTLDYTSSVGNIINVTNLEIRRFEENDEFQFLVKMNRISPTTKLPDTSGTTRVGDMLQFSLNATLPTRDEFQLFPQNCYVSDQPNSNLRYSLLKDRCPNPADSSISVIDKNGPSVTIAFRAFRFVGVNTNRIYVTCQVLICKNFQVPGMPMYGDCMYCNGYMRRRKREIPSTSDKNQKSTTITSELVIILDDEQQSDISSKHGPDNSFSGTKGTIILILLIIVILMGVAYLVKKILNPARYHMLAASKEDGMNDFAMLKI